MKVAMETKGTPKFRIEKCVLVNIKGSVFEATVQLSEKCTTPPALRIITDATNGDRFLQISFPDGRSICHLNITAEQKGEQAIFDSKIYPAMKGDTAFTFLFLPKKFFKKQKEILSLTFAKSEVNPTPPSESKPAQRTLSKVTK